LYTGREIREGEGNEENEREYKRREGNIRYGKKNKRM